MAGPREIRSSTPNDASRQVDSILDPARIRSIESLRSSVKDENRPSLKRSKSVGNIGDQAFICLQNFVAANSPRDINSSHSTDTSTVIETGPESTNGGPSSSTSREIHGPIDAELPPKIPQWLEEEQKRLADGLAINIYGKDVFFYRLDRSDALLMPGAYSSPEDFRQYLVEKHDRRLSEDEFEKLKAGESTDAIYTGDGESEKKAIKIKSVEIQRKVKILREEQKEFNERIKEAERRLFRRQFEGEVCRCEVNDRVYTAGSLRELVDVLKEQGFTATEKELAKLKKLGDTCNIDNGQGGEIEAKFLSLKDTAEKREREKVKKMADRIGRPEMCGKEPIGENFVSFKVSGKKLDGDVNHDKVQLAGSQEEIAERVGGLDGEEAREQFYKDLKNGSAKVGDRTVEILLPDKAEQSLQEEEAELRDGINKLAVRDWGKKYEGKEVQLWEKPDSFTAYTVDELMGYSGKSEEDIAQIKPGETLKISGGETLTRPTLYKESEAKEADHKNRKKKVANDYEDLTGIKIVSLKDVRVYEFKGELYVTEKPGLSVQDLKDQGVTVTEQELKDGNAEVALRDAQDKLEKTKKEREQNIENLVKELGREDLADIEDLSLNDQEKKLQKEVEDQKEKTLELMHKYLGDHIQDKEAGVCKFDARDWTGWTPEELKDELVERYKKKNISVAISASDLEKIKKCEKCTISAESNDGQKRTIEIQFLDLKHRVQYLEGKLKDKYIGEIRKIQNEISGEDSEPVEVDWQQAEKRLESLKKVKEERVDYIKEIEPDGQVKAIYCEVIVDGKSEILDYQNLEAMKKGLKDRKLVPDEHLEDLKKAGSEYSEGDITVRYLPLDEVVEKLPLQRIKDMEAYKIREKLEAGKVYQHPTTNQIHFGDTPTSPGYNEVTDGTQKGQIIEEEVKKQLLENFAIYRDQNTGHLYPTTDHSKAKAYFNVTDDIELDGMALNEVDQKKAAKDIFSWRKGIAERAKEWWGENLKDFDDANNFPPLYKITFKGGPKGGNLYLPSTIKAAFHDTALVQDLANLEPGQSITYGGDRVEKISIISLSVNEAWDEMQTRKAEREKIHAIVEEERRRQIENKKVGIDESPGRRIYPYDSIPKGITEVTDGKDKRSFIEQDIQIKIENTKVYEDKHGRIYAGSPNMAGTFFNVEDINALVGDTGNSLGLKVVPEDEWAVVLPNLQEQRQADAQLRASMGKDQIFGYISTSGDKGALAPTRREVAEKLLPAERSSVFGKNIKDIEERLEEDLSLRPMTSVEARDWYIEERYKMICDQSGDPAELKDLKSEMGIQRLDDLEKQRTDNIKRAHKFVVGKDIQSKNVGGFIVKEGDGSEKFYNADDFPVLIQYLRGLKKKGSLPLGWKDLDELARMELKVGDPPYKVDTDNKHFKRFGPEIEVKRVGLEYTEEEMQKDHIMKLARIIRGDDTIDGIDPLGGKQEISRLRKMASDYAAEIDPLLKDVYNETPDATAEPEDRCGYLVGNMFYTSRRFQQWALKQGISKTLAVGDPPFKHTTKSGVTYEITHLGLEPTGQQLREWRKKIHWCLEQLVRLPKTDTIYSTFRIVCETVDNDGNWTRDYSTIDIAENRAALEDRIKGTHFKGKDSEPDGDPYNKPVGESVQYTGKDEKTRVRVERIAENEAYAELNKAERKNIEKIAGLQGQLGSKAADDISGGEDVRECGRLFCCRIRRLDSEGKDRVRILQVAGSPKKMAERLVARGIKDKDGGIAKMREKLSNIENRDSKEENYEFTAETLGKDGSKSEVTYIIEKAEIAEIKLKIEKDIVNARRDLINQLPKYDQANPWNYEKIYAGNYKDWGENFCFVEVDGKLRFGESLAAIKKEFPGKEYKEISPYAAGQKLERLTKDHGARITLMENVYAEQRERVKQAFPEVNFDDPKLEIGYRFEFLSAEEHYDFEYKGKRYIGASLTEAAGFLGVKRKQLEKLAELTEVDKDGYFTGSSGEIRRREVDSDTVEVALKNRHRWAIDPIHMFRDARGKIWFTDNEDLGSLLEFQNHSMVRVSKEGGINIGNVVNPNPLNRPDIKLDLTDPKKSHSSDSGDGADADEEPFPASSLPPEMEPGFTDTLPTGPIPLAAQA